MAKIWYMSIPYSGIYTKLLAPPKICPNATAQTWVGKANIHFHHSIWHDGKQGIVGVTESNVLCICKAFWKKFCEQCKKEFIKKSVKVVFFYGKM
jgi:hypothetical protein